MHLVQFLLPLSDNNGKRFSRGLFEQVEKELVAQFEGFTAFPRAPASGLWVTPTDDLKRDDMIVYEVLVSTLDRDWWTNYRAKLQDCFQQDEVLVRATETEML
jgi:hypothetical protein